MPTSLSQDYALQAAKGIKEVFRNSVNFDLNVFKNQKIVEYYSTDEFAEIFTSTEGLSGVRTLAEKEAPPVLALEDGYSITVTEERFGGAIELSETAMRQARDNTTKIDGFLTTQNNQLLQDTRQHILEYAFYMLNQATNTSALTLAPDGKPLLSATHTWATPGAATWNNLATTTFDEDAVDTAMIYAGNFTMADGKPRPLNFDTIIVKKGSNTARAAIRLFASQITPVAVDDVNVYHGAMTIIETPYITSQTSWFLRDSSIMNSVRLGIGQAPSLSEPIVQNNSAIRMNATGFMKRGIYNMPYDWYGYIGS